MAAVRRGHSPLTVDLSTAPPSDLPPISALFLIYFDIKAGYTIGWKRSVPGVELEGVVEYKSLPSGLHTVKEDLIYFVHENHAGLSAFINAPADEESRNARMIAVGVMVPLSYGRLGRSWKHAEKLKEMASELILDTAKTQVLEEYWEQHKMEDKAPQKEPDSIDSPSDVRYEAAEPLTTGKAKSSGRNRSISDGHALHPQTLSKYHPAWSLPDLLDIFGPLIFPIHRAALLRKRILITGHTPVEQTCNFVYDLSILSNIPLAVIDLLPSATPPQRLRPLFSIGVHDIPLLEEDLKVSRKSATSGSTPEEDDETSKGWIACTTDSILAMKSKLYDVLITMPAPYSSSASQKVWPKVESPQGVELRATQRDLRRYRALRWGLSRSSRPNSPDTPDEARSSSFSQNPFARDDPMLDIPDTDLIVEPLSWSALAYSGFMWWASAGEGQRLDIDAEADSDSALLSGLSLTAHTPSTGMDTTSPRPTATQETAIIAYFHRLTTQYLTTIADIVDAADATDEDDEPEHSGESGELLRSSRSGEPDDEDVPSGPTMYVTSGDMGRLGLDVWSMSDHGFVEDVARLYFGMKAQVECKNVDICGVRIC
ncbi:hypothetical protein BP6252_07840 [Coleophoma cylindrospora]|uniref:DUF4484 domain-containing protein n=1 Tax=Coleophoma cylindrospora TaxID=1849047 RepID=A0A3D8RB49_9HELO|nr:hypothetical protein BP6252_07840 [Coleophoma cylindrospora]